MKIFRNGLLFLLALQLPACAISSAYKGYLDSSRGAPFLLKQSAQPAGFGAQGVYGSKFPLDPVDGKQLYEFELKRGDESIKTRIALPAPAYDSDAQVAVVRLGTRGLAVSKARPAESASLALADPLSAEASIARLLDTPAARTDRLLLVSAASGDQLYYLSPSSADAPGMVKYRVVYEIEEDSVDLRKAGFALTVPLDIVTFPVQFIGLAMLLGWMKAEMSCGPC